MTLFVPRQSESLMLQDILNHRQPSDPIMKLYVNNVSPADTDTAATYTEMGTHGYASIPLQGVYWAFSVAVRPAVASFATQVYQFNGNNPPVLVYGYYLVESLSGLLIAAERFSDGPYTVQNNGDSITIIPAMSLT